MQIETIFLRVEARIYLQSRASLELLVQLSRQVIGTRKETHYLTEKLGISTDIGSFP